jgi:hypothetical protein
VREIIISLCIVGLVWFIVSRLDKRLIKENKNMLDRGVHLEKAIKLLYKGLMLQNKFLKEDDKKNLEEANNDMIKFIEKIKLDK